MVRATFHRRTCAGDHDVLLFVRSIGDPIITYKRLMSPLGRPHVSACRPLVAWACFLGLIDSLFKALYSWEVREEEVVNIPASMSDQPPFLSQTSGPSGPVYSSQNAPRTSTITPTSPPPGSVYPPQSECRLYVLGACWCMWLSLRN